MKLYEMVNVWIEGNISGKMTEVYKQVQEVEEVSIEDIEEIYKYFPCYENFSGKTLDELKQMNKEKPFDENENIASILFVKTDELIRTMEEEKISVLTWEKHSGMLKMIIVDLLANLIYRIFTDESKASEINALKNILSNLHEDTKVEVEEIEKAGAKKSNTEAMNSICKSKFKASDDEVVTMIEIGDLKNLESFIHPYAKSLERNEQAIDALAEDIKLNGVISPIIVRRLKGSKYYEILSGHRRTKAAKKAKLDMIPAIIKENITDEEAVCIITDNENQRKNILPSERAKAYKIRKEIFDKNFDISMKLAKSESEENIEISTEYEDSDSRCTGCNGENTVAERWTDTEEGKRMLASLGVERVTFYKYIKLNDLTEELLDMVDDKKIPIKVAVQLSKLDRSIQEFMPDYLSKEKLTENDAIMLVNEQETLIEYNLKGNLSVENISELIENAKIDCENGYEEGDDGKKEKIKKAKINMTKIFGEIRKELNNLKGNDKKRFEKITEERFREITTEAVIQAVKKELSKIGKAEIDSIYETE